MNEDKLLDLRDVTRLAFAKCNTPEDVERVEAAIKADDAKRAKMVSDAAMERWKEPSPEERWQVRKEAFHAAYVERVENHLRSIARAEGILGWRHLPKQETDDCTRSEMNGLPAPWMVQRVLDAMRRRDR